MGRPIFVREDREAINGGGYKSTASDAGSLGAIGGMGAIGAMGGGGPFGGFPTARGGYGGGFPGAFAGGFAGAELYREKLCREREGGREGDEEWEGG